MMRLLLDTHVLLWWLADMPSLTTGARAAIQDTNNVIAISAVSVWEIAIKRSLGKLQIPDSWCDAIVEEPFEHLPIQFVHCRTVEELPLLHRDPFDRLLVAQAIVEKATLVTFDEDIRRYDVPCLSG